MVVPREMERGRGAEMLGQWNDGNFVWEGCTLWFSRICYHLGCLLIELILIIQYLLPSVF